MSTPAFCYFDSDLDDSEYEFKLHPVAFLNSDSDVESVDMNECIHGTRSRSCDPNDVDTFHLHLQVTTTPRTYPILRLRGGGGGGGGGNGGEDECGGGHACADYGERVTPSNTFGTARAEDCFGSAQGEASPLIPIAKKRARSSRGGRSAKRARIQSSVNVDSSGASITVTTTRTLNCTQRCRRSYFYPASHFHYLYDTNTPRGVNKHTHALPTNIVRALALVLRSRMNMYTRSSTQLHC